MSGKRKIIAAFVLLAILLAFAYRHAPVRLLIVANKAIIVEVARTPQQQQKGLQNRKSLGKDRGMLFIFKEESDHAFWMKDTYIPLDILCINENKIICDIQEMTPDQTDVKYHSAKCMKYALEVNAGWCKKNNIKIGDKVYF